MSNQKSLKNKIYAYKNIMLMVNEHFSGTIFNEWQSVYPIIMLKYSMKLRIFSVN